MVDLKKHTRKAQITGTSGHVREKGRSVVSVCTEY